MESDKKFTGEIRNIVREKDRIRLILLSDCQSHSPYNILDRIRNFNKPIDAILYGGDGLTRFYEDGRNYLEEIAEEAKLGLFAVAGNDDPVGDKSYIDGKNVYDVHDNPVTIGQFAIVGQEGYERRDDVLPLGGFGYSREEIENRLQEMLEELNDRQVIILSHTPPFGNLDRAVRWGKRLGMQDGGHTSRNIGSKGLASILKESESVSAVVCGHVHQMGGRLEESKGTRVVNVASQDSGEETLNIGYIDLLDSGRIRRCAGQLSSRDFRDKHPRSEIGRELLSIPGIGFKTARKLSELGIESIEKLAETSSDTLRKEIPHSSRGWETLVGRARAQHNDSMFVLGDPDIPRSPRIYLDIETDLDPESLVWLIGTYHDLKEEQNYFFAEKPGEEKKILREFLSFLEQNPEGTLLHYSTHRFDERILRKRLEANNLPVPDRLKESVDVGIVVENCVALPKASNQLSSIAKEAGYEFEYPSIDGVDITNTYLNCVRKGERAPKRVFEYNRDDVLAVRKIVDWLESKVESK